MAQTPVRFGAVGDIALSGGIGDMMTRHGGSWPFARARPELARAELLFGNMESVSVAPDAPPGSIDESAAVLHSTPSGPSCAGALREAGFGFLNLAANHALDAGSAGLEYTQRCLEAAGIATGGVGRTQAEARRLRVVECGGVSFGFLCYAEDSNYTLGHREDSHAFYELEAVLQDVAENRARVDVLVVSIHADLEFMPTPSAPRLRAAREIARAGAKLVLQHHPHVPQGVEMAHGALIAYSLGNFVFPAHSFPYMRDNGPHTASTFLLLAEVTRQGVVAFDRVPFRIEEPPEERPVPLTGAAAAEMRAHFAQLDAWLQDGEFVRRTWREAAKRHFAAQVRRAASRLETSGVDGVIEDLVCRLCLVAENRSWMEEILAAAQEHWQVQLRNQATWRRPLSLARQDRPAGPAPTA
jgi:hypothetical protein